MLTERKAGAADGRSGSGGETAAGRGGRRTSPLFEASLLGTAVFLGTNPVAVKYAVGYIPQMPFVTMRFVLAGLVLWGILRLFDPKGGLRRGDFWAMAGLGLVGIALNNLLFTHGVSMTSASNSALVVATAPLWGMLLAFVLGWESPKLKGIVGVGLALLGVAVIVYRGLGDSGASLPGDLLVMGAAVCWGSYAVLSLPLLERYSPLAVAAYSMLFGGLAVLPLASVQLPGVDWEAVSAAGWGAFAYSALVVAAFGFTFWQRGISRIGANRMLVYQYLITLVGVVAGVWFFDEGFGIDKVVGAAILLGGVYLARRQ
ncbi:MAG TPA: DMT family transporter [Rubrobacteraceae bacterium]|nr:DMT family transporter [Rubrobacteraceae bacterium]